MARDKLTATKVRALTKPGRYNDGAGLYLFVDARGSRSWVFRYTSPTTGAQRDMGLGPCAVVTLEHARRLAQSCRVQIVDSIDPIDAKRSARGERLKQMTFKQCADALIDSRAAGWRNTKHTQQWRSTLDTYAAKLMPLPVADIDTGLVLRCIEPEWASKTETMSRVRQRIEAVLSWATVRKYRHGDNPARWRGHLEFILPKRSAVAPPKHREAVAVADIATFMGKLRQHDGFAARALAFQILTATRPGEAAGARWDEIDLDAALWIVPPERMKAGIEHRVPLSRAAVALLEATPRMARSAFVFPSVRGNKPITTAAGMKIAKTIRPGITAHGFRSTFRDWAGDMTKYPRELIESALAHRLKDKAEAAYRRSDALARRAKLMEDWATYCAAVPK